MNLGLHDAWESGSSGILILLRPRPEPRRHNRSNLACPVGGARLFRGVATDLIDAAFKLDRATLGIVKVL